MAETARGIGLSFLYLLDSTLRGEGPQADCPRLLQLQQHKLTTEQSKPWPGGQQINLYACIYVFELATTVECRLTTIQNDRIWTNCPDSQTYMRDQFDCSRHLVRSDHKVRVEGLY